MFKQGSRTQNVHTFSWTADGLYEFRNKGSDGGQFEDIEVTEIILGVGESYDVKIILPDITDANAYDPIIVRLVMDRSRRTNLKYQNGNKNILDLSWWFDVKEKTNVEKSTSHMLIVMFNELVNLVKLGYLIIFGNLMLNDMNYVT